MGAVRRGGKDGKAEIFVDLICDRSAEKD